MDPTAKQQQVIPLSAASIVQVKNLSSSSRQTCSELRNSARTFLSAVFSHVTADDLLLRFFNEHNYWCLMQVQQKVAVKMFWPSLITAAAPLGLSGPTLYNLSDLLRNVLKWSEISSLETCGWLAGGPSRATVWTCRRRCGAAETHQTCRWEESPATSP